MSTQLLPSDKNANEILANMDFCAHKVMERQKDGSRAAIKTNPLLNSDVTRKHVTFIKEDYKFCIVLPLHDLEKKLCN